jgi:hypothetical protein
MMPPVQRHSWVGSLKYPHGHPCRFQLLLDNEPRMPQRRAALVPQMKEDEFLGGVTLAN